MKKHLGPVTKMSRLIYPGDHIVAERSRLGIPYEHHGIFVGDSKVIHFAGNKICYVTLDKFIGADDIWINSHKGQRMYSAADVIARARCKLGFDKYDLIDHNCEHFAEWCITGKEFSKQVDDLPWLQGAGRKKYSDPLPWR